MKKDLLRRLPNGWGAYVDIGGLWAYGYPPDPRWGYVCASRGDTSSDWTVRAMVEERGLELTPAQLREMAEQVETFDSAFRSALRVVA